MIKEERREQIRFSLPGEKKLEDAYFYESHAMDRKIEGEIMDISSTGLSISVAMSLITKPLKKLDVIKTVVPVSKGLPGIPTLGEVRWIVSKDDGIKRYIIGIRFVI